MLLWSPFFRIGHRHLELSHLPRLYTASKCKYLNCNSGSLTPKPKFSNQNVSVPEKKMGEGKDRLYPSFSPYSNELIISATWDVKPAFGSMFPTLRRHNNQRFHQKNFIF